MCQNILGFFVLKKLGKRHPIVFQDKTGEITDRMGIGIP